MNIKCPNCEASRLNISKNGFFERKSDSKIIQKFLCKLCKKQFSLATFSPCYHQNKRRLNFYIRKDLASSTSMRRIALNYGISRTTVKRKLVFLAEQAKLKHSEWLKDKCFNVVEFDDLETFEHTKCKPLSVSMAVESKTRKIIGFRISPMGAKGLLAKPAKQKYGKRKNETYKKRRELFEDLKKYVDPKALFKSDMHKQYPLLVKTYFPEARHRMYKGAKGSLTGQGELKKQRFDPLYSVNHIFAMLRDNIKRLSRKTWCTTKKLEGLEQHIWVYLEFHNQVLT